MSPRMSGETDGSCFGVQAGEKLKMDTFPCTRGFKLHRCCLELRVLGMGIRKQFSLFNVEFVLRRRQEVILAPVSA